MEDFAGGRRRARSRALIALGALLIVLGSVSLTLGGVTYTRQTDVFVIGDVEVEAVSRRTIPLPPLLGGLTLVGGIAFVLIGRR